MGIYERRPGSSSGPGRPCSSSAGDEHGQTNVTGPVARSSPCLSQGRSDVSGDVPGCWTFSNVAFVPFVALDPDPVAGSCSFRPSGLSNRTLLRWSLTPWQDPIRLDRLACLIDLGLALLAPGPLGWLGGQSWLVPLFPGCCASR